MTATDAGPHGQVHEPNDFGYRAFSLGQFHFSRDEYFAYVSWPTGHHVMSVDAFLRAMQRDVAWEFFYGIVNFDGVIGTMNHYGTVDLFAGRYNDAYRRAELDHVETVETKVIHETFAAILSDWTNEGFDPFASPEETGSAFGSKHGNNDDAISRHRVTAKRMVSLPDDEPLRSDDNGHPVNRMSADVPQDEPEVYAEPGFESEVGSFNLFAYLSRSQVTWNPSVVSVCRESLYCPTTEEYILPIIHGNEQGSKIQAATARLDELVYAVPIASIPTLQAIGSKVGNVTKQFWTIEMNPFSPVTNQAWGPAK